jgi:glutathione synthase/RimK-type ligase-like ATP-grasp enzyme
VTSILISTEVLDTHAIAGEIALTQRGHHVVRLFGDDLPQKLSGSFQISSDSGPKFEIAAPGLMRCDQTFDILWNRRPRGPVLPPDLLHEDDVDMALVENVRFLEGMWSYFARDAIWINPPGGAQRATSKVLQLTEARRAGFAVPRTLICNRPEEVRAFVRANQPSGTIFKAFAGYAWDLPDGGSAMNYTVKVTESSLPSDAMLRAVPGIYQQLVPKAFELRVTYFGSHGVAAKLLSQSSMSTALDWRMGDPAAMQVEPYQLPPEVDAACRQVMRRLGIVFGSFDLIVTPQGDHVFLEVNQMGQFLWLELANPELALLDMFVNFVEAGACDFAPKAKPLGERVCFHSIANSPEYQKSIEFDVTHHLGANLRTVGPTDVASVQDRCMPPHVCDDARKGAETTT